MNSTFDVIHDGAVAIRESNIVAVASSAAIVERYHAEQVVSCKGQYILPGLINAHTHVPMTLLRGMSDDLRLDVWLIGYIMPTEREFVSPEFCRMGTKLACAEMIRGGVTTFADMYYFEAEIAETTAEAGLRGVLGQTILKFPAPDAETYEHSLEYAQHFIEKWKNHPLITPAVAPHAPYTNTEETLRKCTELALKYDVPQIIHLAESKLEVEDNQRDYGKTVIPWVKSVGLFESKVLAAHCVHVDDHEIRNLRDHGVSVAHCPSANLKLASGIAPIKQMLDYGVTVGIGTDGPASNNDLDMFEEMRLAALLAKTASMDPTALPARQALLMATRQGAKALFLDDVTGSLEVGKRADIIVVDSQPLHNMPHYDVNKDAVYSQIVYAGKSSDVRHVMVNGKWLMRDRQLLTLNEEELRQKAAEYATQIGVFLGKHEEDVLRKLLAIGGGIERAESFEVQAKAVLRDPSIIEELLSREDVEVLRSVHYRQYDTYFVFDDSKKGRLRYREDDRMDENGNVQSVRSRLTFTEATKEREFNRAVLLSRSRFIAPADRPLRFYQEYFHGASQRELIKERRRWRINYQDVLYFVNVDRVLHPPLPDTFIEIKSHTWSLSDAENKAARIREMLKVLGIDDKDIIHADYLEMEGIKD
jgi:5-methylthioadenosine/S-adenosylhomocysteine deaminase